MKAYLAVTGTIFGLMTVLHVMRAIDERATLTTDPLAFLSMAAIGLISAGLSTWAWRLFRQ